MRILMGWQLQLLNPSLPTVSRKSGSKRKSSYLQSRCDQKWLQTGRDNIVERGHRPPHELAASIRREETWGLLCFASAGRKDFITKQAPRAKENQGGLASLSRTAGRRPLLLRICLLGRGAREDTSNTLGWSKKNWHPRDLCQLPDSERVNHLPFNPPGEHLTLVQPLPFHLHPSSYSRASEPYLSAGLDGRNSPFPSSYSYCP